MLRRSQTATEYLIILAVVIIIGLIVVAILGGIPGIGGGTGSRSAQTQLATAAVGVTSHAITNESVVITLRNNQQETIVITNISLDGVTLANCMGLPLTLRVGHSQEVICLNSDAVGAQYEREIAIDYLRQGISFSETPGSLTGTVGASAASSSGEIAAPSGYILTISVDGQGSYTNISVDDDIIQLEAIPNSGWEFSYWEGDVWDENSAITNITMDASNAVTVYFVEGSAPINGSCGPAHGQSFSSEPTEGLCDQGNPSEVSGNGPWEWICEGINGGQNSNTCTAQVGSPGGDGSPSSPFVITTCQGLDNIRDDLSAHYVLGGNIDCSDTADWNDGNGFMPISSFSGTLDGQGNVINNLYIFSDSARLALFDTGSNAIVKNIGLKDVNITQTMPHSFGTVGGIFSRAQGVTISNSYVTGSLTGVSWMVGGLIGTCHLCSLENVYFSGKLYSTGNSSSWPNMGCLVGGGISGGATAQITNSYSDCDINVVSTGQIYGLGGLVGEFGGGGSSVNINSSFSSAKIHSLSDRTAMIYASSNGVNIQNSYWLNRSSENFNCYSGGNEGCVEVSNFEYFYTSNNAPMNQWDFNDVWKEVDGDYPKLTWQD